MPRRLLAVLASAVVFFTISFAVTYWVLTPSHVPEVELVEEAETPITEVLPIVEEEPLDATPGVPPEVPPPTDAVAEVPAVEVAENPPDLTHEELVEQRILESMAGEMDFRWDDDQRYVGVLGQYVAVFKGQPGVGGMLVEETDIPIANLPEFEVRHLRQGVAFSTEEQKYSILEGLHFPK